MFSKFGFKTKLLLLCCFMASVSVSIATTAFFGLNRVTDKYENVSGYSLPNIVSLGEMYLQYRRVRINLRTLGLPGLSRTDAEHYIAEVHAAIKSFEAEHKKYSAMEFRPGERELSTRSPPTGRNSR